MIYFVLNKNNFIPSNSYIDYMIKLLKYFLILFILNFSYSYAKGKVIHIKVEGGIGPATTSFIESGIEFALEKKANALIISLNTPGGLLESTRDIVQKLLTSKIPVIVYVSPSGSRAGSAGVFITLSAHIAAMAPGTNIGAAHPVGLGGESDSNSTMYDKITNDAAAFIRSIAQKRKRNEQWAEAAVRESISATENEALAKGAIDVIAPNLDSLLKVINGWTVELPNGKTQIETADVEILVLEKNWRQELLGILSDPNIAYIFVMLAIYGIMFELYNPGSIFPGVIGGISAILAAYSLQMLPVNYAGLALILLSIILFLVEIKVTSYGLLSIGGAISLLLGSMMLIDSPLEFINISMSIIITSVILTVIFFAFIITLGMKAQKRKKATGTEAIIGEIGKAQSDISPAQSGMVKVHGELWRAESDQDIKNGEEIIVENVSGLKIKVRRKN